MDVLVKLSYPLAVQASILLQAHASAEPVTEQLTNLLMVSNTDDAEVLITEEQAGTILGLLQGMGSAGEVPALLAALEPPAGPE